MGQINSLSGCLIGNCIIQLVVYLYKMNIFLKWMLQQTKA